MLRLHILPVIGDRAIEDVRPRDVQQVVNTMTQGPATKHHAHKVMYALYRWMVRNRMVEHSPVDGIRLPTITTDRKSLSSAEVVKLLESMKDSRWKYSVQLILMTGLRRGELLALRWEDIDDCIHIRRTRSPDGQEGPPKSQAGNRAIMVGKAVQGVLDAQRDMLRIEGIVSPYVFPGKDGKGMSPSTYHHIIDYHAKKAEMQVSVHELRHTFVSLSAKGMDLKALQAILGHTKASVTLDVYRHMIAGDEQHAADLVDEAAYRLGIVPSMTVNG
jgi:integrase